MLPFLINFSFLKIPTYGFFMALGFFTSLLLIYKKAKKENLCVNTIINMVFISFIIGLIGARALFITTTWDLFEYDFLEVLRFWQGGLVFYGGLIAGIGAVILFCFIYKLPILKVLDIAAPSMALAHAFGRLGCFGAGCCFGHPAKEDFPLAVIFNHPLTVAPQNIPLHPAQLYDSTNTLIIFLILQWLYTKKRFDGQVIACYGMLYAIGRWFVEDFRGDSIRGFVFNDRLSTSQFISLIIFTLSLTLLLSLFFKQKKV